MKAHYRTASGHLTFEVEGGSPKDLFENIANLQSVFEAEERCGLCDSPAIRFRVREAAGNKYYELFCVDCRARFSFGQHRQGGGLFPKRRDEAGNLLPSRGWARWEPAKPQKTSAA